MQSLSRKRLLCCNQGTIKMYLLSQGSWVKVLAPQEFVDEMKTEIEKMKKMYK